MPEEQIKVGLDREQKIGFVLLLIFALLTVGLGLIQLRNNLYQPFALKNTVPPDIADSVDTNRALHYRDTDNDSLTDFDELYVYGTSPYLADTDSDGLPDNKEIEQGTSPLCDEKKGNCAGLAMNPVFTPATSTPAALGNLTAPIPPANLDLVALLRDPAQVRQMLLGAGVEADILNKISDKELMKMVEQIMTTSTLPAASAGQGIDYASIKKLNSLATTTK